MFPAKAIPLESVWPAMFNSEIDKNNSLEERVANKHLTSDNTHKRAQLGVKRF